MTDSERSPLDTSIWNDIKDYFGDDGSLQDIFCVGCSREHQVALLQFFMSSQFRTLVRDGKRDDISPDAYPKNLEAYFADKDDSYLMTVFVGECPANFWLWSNDGYIELDLDSWCVIEEKDFVAVCHFMKAIGSLISKKVNYTWEGANGAVFHYDPSTQRMYLGGERRR